MAARSADPEMEQWSDMALELDPDAFLSMWARQLTTAALHDWPRSHAAGEAAQAMSGRREYISPMSLATLEAVLGDTDAALAHCREGMAIHDPQFIIFAHGWPNAEALRALPGHRAMLFEIGLPGVQRD